ERGDRVALLSENRPEWAWVDYALLSIGVWTVPIYATLPAPQVAFIVRHSGARVLFVSTADQLEKVLSVRAELPELEQVVVLDTPPFLAAGVTRLEDLLREGAAAAPPEAEFRAEALQAKPDDVATLIY